MYRDAILEVMITSVDVLPSSDFIGPPSPPLLVDEAHS